MEASETLAAPEQGASTEPAPAGSPFADAPSAPPTPPASEQPAAPEGTPDLSEQEQALEAKLTPEAIAEAVVQAQQKAAEPEPEVDTDLYDLFAGEDEAGEPEPYVAPQVQADAQQLLQTPQARQLLAEGHAPADVAAHLQNQLQQQQAQAGTTDPQVARLLEEQEQIIEYLAQREERERRDELDAFAAANPDIKKADISQQVVRVVNELAERAGDLSLRKEPSYIKTAFHAVMAQRSQPPGVPQSQARTQGAPLETDAGAAVDGQPSKKDQWWEGIKQAGGGSAFGD